MNAWLKRKISADEVIKIIPDTTSKESVLSYHLQLAYEFGYLAVFCSIRRATGSMMVMF
jgi:hypothetical protein